MSRAYACDLGVWRMRTSATRLAAAAALLLAAAPAAAVPSVITHEGMVLDADGIPIDGAATMVFTIYDAPEGGAVLWTEEHSFDLAAGYYSLVFGEGEDLHGIFDGGPAWLGISVDGAAELTPRQPFSSVPFAFVAGNATGDITPSSISVGGVPVVDATGGWVGPQGSGSGLDADRLDGKDSTQFFQPTGDGAAVTLRGLLSSADGSGSGLDADVLDGLDSSKFMRVDAATGTSSDLNVGGIVSTTGVKVQGFSIPGASNNHIDGYVANVSGAISSAGHVYEGSLVGKGSNFTGTGMISTGAGEPLSAIVYGDWNDLWFVHTDWPGVVRKDYEVTMALASSGNVGIGTASPSAKLHVAGPIQFGRGGYGVGIGTSAPNLGSVTVDTIESASGNDPIELGAYSGAPVHAMSHLYVDGNTGLGTTSPTARLDVRGDINLPTGAIRFDSGTTAGTAGIASSDYARIYGEHNADAETSRLVFDIADNTDEAFLFRLTQCCGNANREPLYMDWNRVLLAKDGGNVGIGTSSPASALHVNGTSGDLVRIQSSGEADIRYIGSAAEWQAGTGWTDNPLGADAFYLYRGAGHLLVDSGGTVSIPGSVGIGTASPAAKLDVRGTLALNDNQIRTRAGEDGCHYIGGEWNFPDSSTGFGHTIASCNSPTRIIAGGHLTGYFADNGNVGIGTSSPQAKLDVAGSVKVSGSVTAASLDVSGSCQANCYRHDANACVLSPRSWTGNQIIALQNSTGGHFTGAYSVCPAGYDICPAHVAKRYCGGEDVKSGNTGGNPYGRHMWVTGWTLSNCRCTHWSGARSRSLYTQHYGWTPIADAPGAVGCPAGSHMAVNTGSPTSDWNYFICAPDSVDMYVLCCNGAAVNKTW